MASPSPLINACLKCDVEEVGVIVIDDSREIFTKDEDGNSALHICARNPDAASCADIIVQAQPEAASDANKSGQTPLHVAAAASNVDFVRRVLATTTRPLSAIDAEKHTPLYTAVSKGSADVCAVILEHTSNVQETDANGASLLHLACRVSGTKGQEAAGLEIIHLLLGKRAAVHATDNEHRTPIMWATLMGNPKAVTLLIDRGADVGSRDRQGKSTIHCAASLGHVEIMRQLLDHRRTQLIDMVDNNNCSPLLLAVGAGHMEAAKMLLDNGADPLRRDKNGRNAFHYAASGLHNNLFPALVEAGVNVWEEAFNGETALHMVCGHEQCGHENCLADGSASLSELLKRTRSRRDLNVTNDLGETALIKAAKGGREDLCEILLKAGADPTIEINRGMLEPLTALDVAVNDNCRQIIQTYIDGKGEVDAEETEKEEEEQKANEDVEGGEKQEARNEDEEKDEAGDREKSYNSNEGEDQEKKAQSGEDKVATNEEETKELKGGSGASSPKDLQSPKTSIITTLSDDKSKDNLRQSDDQKDERETENMKGETVDERDVLKAEEKQEMKAIENTEDEKMEKQECQSKAEKVEEDGEEKKDEEEKKKDDEVEKEIEEKEDEEEKKREDKEEREDEEENEKEDEEKAEEPKTEEKDGGKGGKVGVSAKKRKKKPKDEGRKVTSSGLAGKGYPKGLLPPLRQVSVDEYYARHPPKPWFPSERKNPASENEDNSKEMNGQPKNTRSRTLSKC